MTFTFFSMNEPTQSINNLLTSVLQERAATISPLAGGYNSHVYKITTDTGNQYVAKQYIAHKGDTRDRLVTEFQGLSFLWNHGIRTIPEPLCLSRPDRIGMYRFIPGKNVKQKDITMRDAEIAAQFLASMHELVHADGADKQPVASEACFSLQGYILAIDQRIMGLLKQPVFHKRWQDRLEGFLVKEFQPAFSQMRDYLSAEYAKRGMNPQSTVPRNKQTLSPTDFSFHNAIRHKTRLYFIDFEYYGWDDPAKVIANFFLHPSVVLPTEMRPVFYERVHSSFAADQEFSRRLPFIYMLMSLKWCLIMLNVFTRKENNADNREDLYTAQLDKAQQQLKKTIKEQKERMFPISLL